MRRAYELAGRADRQGGAPQRHQWVPSSGAPSPHAFSRPAARHGSRPHGGGARARPRVGRTTVDRRRGPAVAHARRGRRAGPDDQAHPAARRGDAGARPLPHRARVRPRDRRRRSGRAGRRPRCAVPRPPSSPRPSRRCASSGPHPVPHPRRHRSHSRRDRPRRRRRPDAHEQRSSTRSPAPPPCPAGAPGTGHVAPRAPAPGDASPRRCHAPPGTRSLAISVRLDDTLYPAPTAAPGWTRAYTPYVVRPVRPLVRDFRVGTDVTKDAATYFTARVKAALAPSPRDAPTSPPPRPTPAGWRTAPGSAGARPLRRQHLQGGARPACC